MNSAKLIALALPAVVSITIGASMLIDPQWLVTDIERNVPSPYNDGTICANFTHRNGVVQTICMEDVRRIAGINPGDPVYYIQDGCMRLF